MTSRERLVAVLGRGVPDRVPVSPDVSYMMPVRYTGQPFWEVLLNYNPPMWQAKLALAERFRFDLILDVPLGAGPNDPPVEQRIVSKDEERWVVDEIIHTRKGDLTTRTVYFRSQSPWVIKPMVIDPENELDALLATFTDCWRKDITEAQAIRQSLGEKGIIAVGTPVPLAWWLYSRRELATSVLDFYDRQTLVEKAMNAYGEWALDWLKATCERLHPDLVMFGGSVASMSVVSPTLYRRYALPWIQKATALAHCYGVFAGVHMCGRSRAALPLLAESGIDLLEPLEALPGGDVVLAEVKKQYGASFCLKGNVNTFRTLAQGGPAEVEAEARRVIEDAGEGGGLILSTGDQTPGDTPEENFVALIKAAKRYGAYV
jgi:hypothetical protein